MFGPQSYRIQLFHPMAHLAWQNISTTPKLNPTKTRRHYSEPDVFFSFCRYRFGVDSDIFRNLSRFSAQSSVWSAYVMVSVPWPTILKVDYILSLELPQGQWLMADDGVEYQGDRILICDEGGKLFIIETRWIFITAKLLWFLNEFPNHCEAHESLAIR